MSNPFESCKKLFDCRMQSTLIFADSVATVPSRVAQLYCTMYMPLTCTDPCTKYHVHQTIGPCRAALLPGWTQTIATIDIEACKGLTIPQAYLHLNISDQQYLGRKKGKEYNRFLLSFEFAPPPTIPPESYYKQSLSSATLREERLSGERERRQPLRSCKLMGGGGVSEVGGDNMDDIYMHGFHIFLISCTLLH